MVKRQAPEAEGERLNKQQPESAHPPRVHWTDRIRERTRELGLTDAEVARRLRLQQSRYSNYVNRSREPDLELFARICRALSTSPDVILGFEEAGTEAQPHASLVARGRGALDTLTNQQLRVAVKILEVLVNEPDE